MRKRVPVVLGGGVALLVASQFFDFGLGFREGSGPADSTADAEMASLEEAIAEADALLPNALLPGVTMDGVTVDDGPGQLSSTDQGASLGQDQSTDESAMEFMPVRPMPPSVVDILIDANEYRVAVNAADLNQREARTLDEIVELVDATSGEENGIRVRIARTPDAIAAAEAAILSRLGEAGLTKDEIDSRRQLVE